MVQDKNGRVEKLRMASARRRVNMQMLSIASEWRPAIYVHEPKLLKFSCNAQPHFLYNKQEEEAEDVKTGEGKMQFRRTNPDVQSGKKRGWK